MKTTLVDNIAAAIARCCVLREGGERVDEAEVIADYLLENGIIEELTEEIAGLEEIIDGYQTMFERCYEDKVKLEEKLKRLENADEQIY